MSKKTLIITIASVLAVALLATGVIFILKSSFSANNGDGKTSKTTITVSSVSGNVGEKITVPVSIKGNPGFMAMLLDFEYDNTALKYTGYTKGDFLTNYQFNDDNGVLRFLTLENDDVEKDGVLVNLEFEVLKSGKSDIKIVVNDDSIANKNEELISAKGVGGAVTGK